MAAAESFGWRWQLPKRLLNGGGGVEKSPALAAPKTASKAAALAARASLRRKLSGDVAAGVKISGENMAMACNVNGMHQRAAG